MAKKKKTSNEGPPGGSSVQPTRTSKRAKLPKPGDKCDARDAVLKIKELSDSSVKVFLAAGWESILPQHGEDDPGLLVMWHQPNLELMVVNINNAGPAGGPAQPAWLAAVVPITEQQLKVAILKHLLDQAGGGGVVGNCIIAPNSLIEYWRLGFAMRDLCFDPFLVTERCVNG
jgi:hypothetical protein